MYLPCEEKMHRFIFAIALSELHLLRQFLAHMYFNKFPSLNNQRQGTSLNLNLKV